VRGALVVVAVACAAFGLSSCTPASRAAPDADPVIIVAGTGAPASFYEPLASRLEAGGYRVWIYVIPSSTSPFERSSVGVADFVDQVLVETGSAKVDMIGHSQGVILMRYAARFLGIGPRIDTMVTLSGGIYGSDLASSFAGVDNCLGLVICQEAATGSAFVQQLNTPTDTIPGVHHVNITTTHEEIATPYTTNLMRGPGDVTNVVVQDQCPADPVEHIFLPFDGAVASGIDDALAKRPVVLDCNAI
jgi:pimeloyl-ACP methyl ester carboxylesterase